MPAELIAALHQHKPQVRAVLGKGAYDPAYPRAAERHEELTDLGRRVEEEGYVLLWSEVLKDLVAFYHSETDRAKIPPFFVPYSDAELLKLFAPLQEDISLNTLRMIHAAKKTGARITGVEPDTA
jgi:hypothetical protein